MSTIPQTGLTTSLVRDTLGETSESAGGAGNNVGKLCVSPKISPWSKHKPFRHSSPIGITEQDILDANFGMQVLHSSASALSATPWEYLKPRGTSYNEPFRIGDFRGYDHAAYVPIRLIETPAIREVIFDKDTGLPDRLTALSFYYTGYSISATYISLGDIFSNVFGKKLSDACICVCAINGTGIHVANSIDTIGGLFGTTPYTNAIDLDNFDIKSCVQSDSDPTGYPAEANVKKKLVLYPKINLFTPTEKGKIYNDANNAPTTTPGSNGYYNRNLVTPFVSWPTNETITIRMYDIDWSKVITYSPQYINLGPYDNKKMLALQSTGAGTTYAINMEGQAWTAGQSIMFDYVFSIKNNSSTRNFYVKLGGTITCARSQLLPYAGDMHLYDQADPLTEVQNVHLAPNEEKTIKITGIKVLTSNYTWSVYSGYPAPPAGYMSFDFKMGVMIRKTDDALFEYEYTGNHTQVRYY